MIQSKTGREGTEKRQIKERLSIGLNLSLPSLLSQRKTSQLEIVFCSVLIGKRALERIKRHGFSYLTYSIYYRYIVPIVLVQ